MLVEVGARRHPCQAVDISAQGAKVSPKVPFKRGTGVRLRFVPPEGAPLHAGALVWRVDSGGVALLFARNLQHPVIRKV